MNIFKKLFSQNDDAIDPICPSCNKTLEKAPGRKTKCPFCGEFIYVRTRPSDRKRVLVTKEGAEKIEEKWAIVSGSHQQYLEGKQEVERTREELRKRFGKEPGENDVLWSLLNKELIKHGSNNDWGLYRNTRLQMGQLLEREKKLKQALATYLEVCYIDINGPENLGGFDKHAQQYPRFNPNYPTAFLAPGLIGMIKILMKDFSMSIDHIKDAFLIQGQRIYESLKLPLSPEETWEKIEEELSKTKVN